jgi:hypothetical protein
MNESEYNSELSKIYKERQDRIDYIYLMYSKGEITNQDKESFLKAADSDAKMKIIKLEKLYSSSNKTY